MAPLNLEDVSDMALPHPVAPLRPRRPLKVVHLTSAHHAFDARILDKECKSLRRRGYDVVEVARHSGDDVVDGVRIKSVPKPGGRLSRVLLCAWRVYREGLRQNADVYHFHDPELIPAALLLRARGKRVIYDIHEDLPRTVQYKTYIPRWLHRPIISVTERLENLVARRFSGLVAATPTIAERFQPLNPNTVVVQNFPKLEVMGAPAQRRWHDRPQSVAYIGSLTGARGVREVVEAVGLLPPAIGGTLTLAGWFTDHGFEQELRRLPAWQRVDWRGRVRPEEIAGILSQVRAGLVVLHPEPNFLLAYPVKLFEYMAAGLPVIASDFPMWRRIVTDANCGLLVDPFDVRAIAQAIEFLLTHPEEAQEMGRRGRVAVERTYNWAAEERKLFDIYARLAPLPS